MKKLPLGTVALLALGLGGTSAMAADMPVYKAQPLPVWTWAGAYFGAHAGGGWGRSQWNTNAVCIPVSALCDPADQRPGGWVAGGQAGARWQWGAWVFGLEATLAAVDIRANDPSPCPPGLGATCIGLIPGAVDVHYDTRISTLYSGTAQLGYAFNRTLWYVKGGWAGAEVRRKVEDISIPAALVVAGETRQARGWTVGAGIEYLVLQNLSLGIEYDYFRLSASAFSRCALPGACLAPVQVSDVRLDIHQVIARANYRLDWGVLWGGPAPVAARN